MQGRELNFVKTKCYGTPGKAKTASVLKHEWNGTPQTSRLNRKPGRVTKTSTQVSGMKKLPDYTGRTNGADFPFVYIMYVRKWPS
ncbi:hypothetical protein PoB_004961200 [Plakobranchus ocellatus]|uniref:Uncharacterized protein n=1 Tax=Plakobranchus ocellatus TaxID=259542 RepID=A0AAV4BUQ8_9GAST|nr:hypothetical protein PoB_004961200 [Plakobranchus ocellatus]